MSNGGTATWTSAGCGCCARSGCAARSPARRASLGLTSSAVSQQLSVLEREAGTPLVDRSPRGAALTGAGHALAERAGQVLDVLAAARADLERLGGVLGRPGADRRGRQRRAHVRLRRRRRAARSPTRTLALSVRAAEPADALRLLLAGDVDLAVVDEYDFVPLALPDFVETRELCDEPLVVVTAAGWAGPRRPTLSQLADADWVMPPDDAACGLAVRSACRAAGFEPRVRWESDDMLVLVRAVAAGHGVAVLPRRSVADDAAEVDVRPLREPRVRRRLLSAARASALARPVVAAVNDSLAAAAR